MKARSKTADKNSKAKIKSGEASACSQGDEHILHLTSLIETFLTDMK